MKIVEIDVRLPYSKRGALLRKLSSKLRGKIKEAHLYPPDPRGFSEVLIEVETDEDPSSMMSELRRTLHGVPFKIKVTKA
jgi:predicted AAA+ superfamily ATPase